MDWSFKLFQNFNVMMIIMPYFGMTHEAFLILSQISKGSRMKLNEFYPEFRKTMNKYWLEVHIYHENIGGLKLPNDLFRFYMWLTKSQDIEEFVKHITNLKEKKGWYFEDNFINEIVNVDDIVLSYELFKELLPYSELLKSVQVISYSRNYNSENETKKTLIDKIVLDAYSYNSFNIQNLINGFVEEIDWVDERSFVPFYRINFWGIGNRLNSIDDLAYLYSTPIKTDIILLEGNNSEDFENIINSEYFKSNSFHIDYNFVEMHSIYDSTFLAIKTLNLKSITFGYEDMTNSYPNFGRILSNLPRKIKINFGFQNYNNIQLTFTNALIKIFQDDKNPVIIKAKTFRYSLTTSMTRRSFNLVTLSENSECPIEYMIQLNWLDDMSFEDISSDFSDDDKLLADKYFSSNYHIKIKESSFIVPLQFLDKVSVNEASFIRIERCFREEGKEICSQFCKAKEFDVKVWNENIINISKWINQFPGHSKYNFSGSRFKKENISIPTEIVSKISLINVVKIRTYDSLDEDNFELVK